MDAPETLQQYYEITRRQVPEELQRAGHTRHFNVLLRKNCMLTMPFGRRDYYKICLSRGQAVLYTEKGEVAVTRPTLFFSNPVIKFGWRNISRDQEGYVCLFNELYVSAELKRELKKLGRLFENEVYSLVTLSDEEYDLFHQYFRLMAEEYAGHFEYKDEVIQSLLKLIIFTAMKIHLASHPSAKAERQGQLVDRFLDALDAQFPIDSPRNPIRMKTPADFADHLNIHVNHLNHTIKSATGKTTSELIAGKRTAEAMALLKNTEWTIAEIGAGLGFDYPQYFNAFFKKQTGKSPKSYRLTLLENL
ncbi:helix-turn-helix transcriptional regulator [Chitinophaga sp.]|uniref:helix-turn-helix domain-containing protein n=1 Tax=Chitinophaga sp. TaxID=1869181 RepID=UPI0031D92970